MTKSARKYADDFLASIKEKVERERDERQRLIREKVINTPKETRQKLLDLIRSGKTLGEAGKECGLEFDVYCQILTDNIENTKYLRMEAI
mgnify:FL=1